MPDAEKKDKFMYYFGELLKEYSFDSLASYRDIQKRITLVIAAEVRWKAGRRKITEMVLQDIFKGEN
jgi:hypothetical protein